MVGRKRLVGVALSLFLILAWPICDRPSTRLFSQVVSATAGADTTTIRVGEQLHVKISVTGPAGFVIRNVGPADSLEGLEIVRVDTFAREGGVDIRNYTVTAFDSGTYVVPPFRVYYHLPPDSAIRNISTLPIAVFVHGIEVDTSAEIRAIKPPLEVPLTFMEVLPWALSVLVMMALIWFVFYYIKKRKRGERLIPVAPPRPADEIALEALRALGAEGLWQRGKLKEYHTVVSDIVRTYIENRFGIPAMESTFDEIIGAAARAGFEDEPVALLRDTLFRSDMVKFAKFIPTPDQNEKSLVDAVSFVEQTRLGIRAGADEVHAGGVS